MTDEARFRYWPPRPSEEQLTTAALSDDGQLVRGWVRKPEGKVWQPEDLLWLPPSATKRTDIDRAGQVVDVTPGLGVHDWVVAQVNRHERYLDVLRARVRSGAIRLTAALAKMLGLSFDDGVELAPRLAGPGPMVATKSYDAEAAALVKRGRELVEDPSRHRYGLCSCHSETGLPLLPGRES